MRIVAALAGGIIANKKGRDTLLWAVACLIFPPAVLVVIFLSPKVAPGKTRRCPYCSRVIYTDETVCRHCKRELPIEMVQCRDCGSFVPDKDYCVHCNKKLRP